MQADFALILQGISNGTGFWEELAEKAKNPWALLGFGGQAVFFCRFLVQWVVSERRKKSVIPIQFWWLSIIGSLMVLIYAIQIVEPVFIIGQSCGLFIYTRNLMMIRTENLRAIGQ
ncbi:MAG: lipid-A-disaccharide synthase N-terminal domain-containing protein [Planctomycetota bacterium]